MAKSDSDCCSRGAAFGLFFKLHLVSILIMSGTVVSQTDHAFLALIGKPRSCIIVQRLSRPRFQLPIWSSPWRSPICRKECASVVQEHRRHRVETKLGSKFLGGQRGHLQLARGHLQCRRKNFKTVRVRNPAALSLYFLFIYKGSPLAVIL